MKITDYLKENILILDGGTGTLLQSSGLSAGELPERWNITHPEVIRSIHRDYFDAGSNIVCTNTFGANILKFSADELREIIFCAVENAKCAARESRGSQPKWVALDVGPTGRMLKPLGDLDFEDAVAIFAETVRLGAMAGADLVIIETMGDSYETKAALLAVKESCDLPVFVSNAYGEDGKLMTGASPAAMVALLEGMGADAIGVNCSLGPRALSSVVREYLKYSSVPVLLKPNAGLPTVVNGNTEYSLSPSEFALEISPLADEGVRIFGGCCGTTPEYISALSSALADKKAGAIEKKNDKLVSSYTHAVRFGDRPILIGERINPTGKPKFRDALKRGDLDYILKEAIAEEEAGAHILDVNVGIPDVNEADMLCSVIGSIQAVSDLPLQIDSSDPEAMEKALRIYNGKAIINSVNGKEESLSRILPLAKKYGGVIVALTLDEQGIPATAEERLEIARRIYNRAGEYGIEPKNLIFDPLAMSVSADKNAARETLRAVKMITEELGCDTLLGVSNVSFGLPERDLINASFFTLALECGLSAAIVNPHSDAIKRAYHAYNALLGLDEGFKDYISLVTETKDDDLGQVFDLKKAIFKGMKEQSALLARELLATREPMSIINEEIIPAINEVGEGFEKKTVYLPSLLMSAEAAGAAFEVIKSAVSREKEETGITVILATVKGDIHDIGKNIVKLLLENYGARVIDLGKDVSPEHIVAEAERVGADLVGLSALMTTTLPAMERTIKLLKESCPRVKTMVGGAVLTPEYADEIGADYYGADAMAAVKIFKSYLTVTK